MIHLTQERESAGLSKAALARKADMHPTTVTQIENGRLLAYPGQMAKLAKALGWDGDPAGLFKEVDADAADARE